MFIGRAWTEQEMETRPGIPQNGGNGLGEGLLPDAWAEALRPDSTALLHLQAASELIEAVAHVGVVDGAQAESTGGQAPRGRVGWIRTPAMLAGSALGLQGGLVAQSIGGGGGRVASGPGLAGVRFAGWRGSRVQKFAGSAKAGRAESRWLGELVEAILLGVGGMEELAHPPDVFLELLARELVEADRGCLRSAHVLH